MRLSPLVRLLIGFAVPRGPHREALLGDLAEEMSTRAIRDGEAASRRWALREALSIAARMRLDRLSPSAPRRDLSLAHDAPGTPKHDTTLTRRVISSRGVLPMDALIANARYALRRMGRSPWFTLTAIVSLGLGIGANTAVFSLVNAVFLIDPGFDRSERLVDVYMSQPGFTHGTLSYPDFQSIEEGVDAFSQVETMRLAFVQLEQEGRLETLTAEAVSGGWFSMLGIDVVLGRGLTPEDHVEPGAHPVVVLGHSTWVNQHGADPGVVGRTIRLGGREYEIVGVANERYRGSLRGLEAQLLLPVLQYDELSGTAGNSYRSRRSQSYFPKATLAAGVTPEAAEAALDRLAADLRAEFPDIWTEDEGLTLVPTRDVVINPMIDRYVSQTAGVLLVVVALVLLIACANLASFLLARASDRRKEIAVRLAMGAKRRALIGQLLTETTLLSVLGGGVGVGVATWAMRTLQTADLPLPLPITLDLSLDLRVLAFSLLVSLVAGLLFGLVPALQATNPALAPTLRDETAGGGRARGAALRNLLVAGQVGVSVVLLVGAGLFLRSFAAMQEIDLGFSEGPAALVELITPSARYDHVERRAFWDRLTTDVERIPGVRQVGITDNIPLNQLNTQTIGVQVDGMEPTNGASDFSVDWTMIDEHFLEAMGIELLAGRGFDGGDTEESQRVVIVSPAFADFFFQTRDVVGRSFTMRGQETVIVGLTEEVKVRTPGEAPRPYLMVPWTQSTSTSYVLVASTEGDADALATQVVRAAQAIDPEIMIFRAMTMDRHLAAMRIGRILGAQVIGGFAALALLLASIGLYGVVAYSVARRSREVGIRISLGAESGQVVRMLTLSGLRIVAAGVVVGLGLSALLTQALSRLLYGVSGLDPVTFVGVPVLILVVSWLASWIPARRATGVDPVTALRSD